MARLLFIPATFVAILAAGQAWGAEAPPQPAAVFMGEAHAAPGYERFRYAAPQADLAAPAAAFRGGAAVRGRPVGVGKEWRLSAGDQKRDGQWNLFVSASANAFATESRDDAHRWSDPAFSDLRDEGLDSKAQAGLVWRKGGARAAIGYVGRSVKLNAPVNNDAYANLPKSDHVAGLSFSFTPH